MRILDAGLDELTEQGALSVLPSDVSEAWELPDRDRRRLLSYGLPPPRTDALLGVAGDYQTGRDAVPVDDAVSIYSIGRFGAARLGACAGSGTVLAVSEATIADIHPQLREQFPDGIRPQLVNSSVTALIDCAWRWHWLLPILADGIVRAGRAEHDALTGGRDAAERAALPDFYEEVKVLCGMVVDRFAAYDGAALAGEDSFWREVVWEDL